MAVIAFGTMDRLFSIGHSSSQEYILEDTVVAAVHHRGSRHFCRMREVIWSGTVQNILSPHGTAAEIVKVGAALGDIVKIITGGEYIIVH